MMNMLEKLQQLADASGPKIQEVEIRVGDVAHKFHFRRLGLLEKQKLDAIPFNFNVETNRLDFDKDKMFEKNIQLLIKSLVDESGIPVLTLDLANALDTDLGEKLIKAAQQVNAMSSESRDEIAKKSVSTPSADTSLT